MQYVMRASFCLLQRCRCLRGRKTAHPHSARSRMATSCGHKLPLCRPWHTICPARSSRMAAHASRRDCPLRYPRLPPSQLFNQSPFSSCSCHMQPQGSPMVSNDHHPSMLQFQPMSSPWPRGPPPRPGALGPAAPWRPRYGTTTAMPRAPAGREVRHARRQLPDQQTE